MEAPLPHTHPTPLGRHSWILMPLPHTAVHSFFFSSSGVLFGHKVSKMTDCGKMSGQFGCSLGRINNQRAQHNTCSLGLVSVSFLLGCQIWLLQMSCPSWREASVKHLRGMLERKVCHLRGKGHMVFKWAALHRYFMVLTPWHWQKVEQQLPTFLNIFSPL